MVVYIKEIKKIKNLFMFQFYHWRDKEKVMQGEPWWVDKKVFSYMSSNEEPLELKPSKTPFWMRVYGLPFN